MMRLSRVLMLALACAACGDDGGPTDPPDDEGTLTAQVQGQAGFTSSTIVAVYVNNSLIIFATQVVGANSRYIRLELNNVPGDGTYSLTSAGNSATFTEVTGSTSQAWLAAVTQGTGSVTLDMDGLHMVGNFNFTAPANAATGATGTRVITQGQFDVVATTQSLFRLKG